MTVSNSMDQLSVAWKDGHLSVSRQGNGENIILFIHGNSSCKEVFATLWQQPEMAQFTCIGLDLPGHGQTSDATEPEVGYTIPGYAAAVGHVIDTLNLSKPMIVGWSLGGHIALELAIHKAGIAGVMITGTPPVGPGPSLLEGGFTPFTFEQSTGDESAPEKALLDYASHTYGTPKAQYEAFLPALFRTPGRARSRMTEHWLEHKGASHSQFAQSDSTPLAIVHGDNDPFVDPDYLEAIATSRLWRGEIHHFPQSGHAPFLDNPTAFASLLKQFVKDVAGHQNRDTKR